MIDLHIHTNYSDGTWSLKKVLEEAEKANLDIISITDHDRLDVYYELEKFDFSKIYSGKIIPGIELSTVYNGVSFHMLVYDFEYNKLNKYIKEKYTNTVDLNKEFEYMINACKKSNLKMEEIEYKKEDGWPTDIIYSEIKKYEENKKYFTEEEWNNVETFYSSSINKKDFPVFLDMSIHYPNAKEVAEEARKAGGKTFIAHVYKYNLEEPIKLLDLLKENNIIDGIEVEYSTFTNEQINTLKKYCKENNLYMSGGTDSHGDKKADRKIGIGYGNMKISKELIKDWYNKSKIIKEVNTID